MHKFDNEQNSTLMCFPQLDVSLQGLQGGDQEKYSIGHVLMC